MTTEATAPPDNTANVTKDVPVAAPVPDDLSGSVVPAVPEVEAVDETLPDNVTDDVRLRLRQQQEQLASIGAQLGVLQQEKHDLTARLQEAALTERQLRASLDAFSTGSARNPLQPELEKKQQQIEEVLKEGEQLSIKQAKLEGIIKNLRAKIRDKEAEIANHTAAIESRDTHIKSLTERVSTLEESDKGMLERIAVLSAQLNESKLELDRRGRESALVDQERTGSIAVVERLEAKLRAHEIESAHWKVAYDEQSEVQERIRVMQDQLREGSEREANLRRNVGELTSQLQSQREQFEHERQTLVAQLQEARGKYDEAEARAEELSGALPSATRPLLRQIEALQSSMRARADAWETVEKTLLQRADDAEATTGALRQERAQLDVRVRELTKRNESLQVEREVARTTVTDLKMQVDKLSERVDSIANERDMKESRIQSLTRQLGQSKSELAERDLRLKEEIAKANNVSERQQAELADLHTAYAELEAAYAKKSQESQRRLSSERRSRQDSFNEQWMRGLHVQLGGSDGNAQGGPEQQPGFPASMSLSSVHALDMGVQIRRQDDELRALKKRLQAAESDRDALSDQLVDMRTRSAQNDAVLQRYRVVEKQLEDLRIRYDTALDIIGEKTDRVDELQADLDESRAIFKQQITELTDQIERLRRQTPNV
ncbi:hypothetical protein PBRA_003125 [Plasmodiophora brassicae]|uniref:TATA element modulatory factor 1 TATA binding domain-containing protein n=1 Tax=Plasmodiophora brassicae TaxID=37360 RepID=A0A0G4J713_PLABS|nr:hypothetical protein PBRA_003125 [Plasmodiophora brassicae]